MSETTNGDSDKSLAPFKPFDFEVERVRDPIDKLHEFQRLKIRDAEFDEILATTTIPDLEAMAQQSTQELMDLLRRRQDTPIEGPDRQISALTLGPRDDEMDGMTAVQDQLHHIFNRMFGHSALLDYQAKVAFDPKTQTSEEYQRAQYRYAREVADLKCSEICPPPEELDAQLWGERSYARYLERRAERWEGSEEQS